MDFQLGTEPREEFLDLELARAAHKLVTEMRPIQLGDQVLITADSASDARVVQATARAVYTVGGVPVVVWYPKNKIAMQEPPRPVARAALGSDVWLDFAVAYLLYSPAYYAALQTDCIYVCLSGMDADMMVRTIGRPALQPIREMARYLYIHSQEADHIRIANPAGTDLRIKVDHDLDDPPWDPDRKGGFPQMLGGQSWFNVVRESAQGILVFDAVIWPPEELGVLRSPVKLHFEKGYVRKIEGGQEAAFFSNWLKSFNHPNVYLLDHVSYGFNPGVTRPSGRIVEDERIFGCMQFGIGATPKAYGSPAHTDGVMLNASVWWDDIQIEDHGRYVHPDLVALCKEMGAAGY